MDKKCGKHGHIGIVFCECRLASLRKQVSAEHELYLTAHRENMKAALRIDELKLEISHIVKGTLATAGKEGV